MAQEGGPLVRIRGRVAALAAALDTGPILSAQTELPGCSDLIVRLRQVLRETQRALDTVPSIEVVFLGPSGHGKSSLMNALAASCILPMSDVKPCTASVVSMQCAEEWSIDIKFISKLSLMDDWQQAVREAQDYLERLRERGPEDEEPDDPRYLQSTLQRFIQLLRIDPEQSAEALVEAVRTGEIPPHTAKLIGETAHPRARDVDGMRETVEKYLSTKDVFWTIVDSCDIRGPFEDWHARLRLLDLPGTNDTNPHRTAITNSLRGKAHAVALVTSDRNLGYDMESWLRNSTVLSEFLEARDRTRQRLFIIRTKFDSYHPEVDETLIQEEDEETEQRLYRDAIEQHKLEQTKAYRAMLREIASPHLRRGATEAERRKVGELIGRLDSIPVFFVSALAHEAFEGRLKATRKTKRRLSEHFNDDPRQTGIPSLRDFLNRIAEEYLAENYYEDTERRLEKEVDQLVRFFRKEGRTLEAELAGAGASVQTLLDSVEGEIIPWMRQEAEQQAASFREEATKGSEAIRSRLDQVWSMSERRFRDKTDKWCSYAWNSLKATARKGGSHTTWRGMHIDINQDICDVLVDDLILAWSSYRDYLIQERIASTTERFATRLQEKLRNYASRVENPDAEAAVAQIMSYLMGIADMRLELVRQLNLKVKQLESIRQPAYQFVKQTLHSTYEEIESEYGVGCQARMHQDLRRGFEANVGHIHEYILQLVHGAVNDLAEYAGNALSGFGATAVSQVEQTLQQVCEVRALRDREVLKGRLGVVDSAMAALPAPSDN